MQGCDWKHGDVDANDKRTPVATVL